ncbi:MAG: endonuclease domain-containing protein [Ginsengibacter sp.]
MKENMFYGSPPIIFANAKRLRNESTGSEVIFWSLLKQHFSNSRFKRQHPVSRYIVDFYCHKLKLVIETDGGIHLLGEVKNDDRVRDEFMQSLNLEIIRFTNDEVNKDDEVVVNKLKNIIGDRG